jgi:hypothetical protein
MAAIIFAQIPRGLDWGRELAHYNFARYTSLALESSQRAF